MGGTEKSESSYYSLSYWEVLKNQKVAITHLAIGIDTQVTHHVVANKKVVE